jgi:hypothetical protein
VVAVLIEHDEARDHDRQKHLAHEPKDAHPRPVPVLLQGVNNLNLVLFPEVILGPTAEQKRVDGVSPGDNGEEKSSDEKLRLDG